MYTITTTQFLSKIQFLLALDTDNSFTPEQKGKVVRAYEGELKLWVLWEDLPTNNSSVSWTYERTWAVCVSHLQKMEKVAQAYLKFENKHLPRETFKGPNFTDENDAPKGPTILKNSDAILQAAIEILGFDTPSSKPNTTLEAYMLGTTHDEYLRRHASGTRYGQWLMNDLHECRFDIHEKIKRTPADCYYDDKKIDAFWHRVSELWDK